MHNLTTKWNSSYLHRSGLALFPRICDFNDQEKTLIAEIILYLGERTNAISYESLFENDNLPGTFPISERKYDVSFLYPEDAALGYEEWVRRSVSRELLAICRSVKITPLSNDVVTLFADKVLEILDFCLASGERLCEAVPYQIYTDIFRRIICFLLTGNPIAGFHTYDETNQFVHNVCLNVLYSTMHTNLDLRCRLKRAVLAGLVGLNLKDEAAATSLIIEAGIIPLNPDSPVPDNVSIVAQDLTERANGNLAVDCLDDFEHEVIHAKVPTKVCILTDDYAETVFDLDFIQALLMQNPQLQIQLIPRRYNFCNDASFRDVLEILSEPYFSTLRDIKKTGRFSVSPAGPLLSAVDPRALSDLMAQSLIRCDILVAKGARAYEMLQGVKKTTYYAFSVAREFSESVTGLNAQLGEPVLVRQPSGEHTFVDFRARAYRKHVLPDGRVIGLAKKTLLEYFSGKQQENAA